MLLRGVIRLKRLLNSFRVNDNALGFFLGGFVGELRNEVGRTVVRFLLGGDLDVNGVYFLEGVKVKATEGVFVVAV